MPKNLGSKYAMLLNPQVGKESNFVLNKDEKYLIPIDNNYFSFQTLLPMEEVSLRGSQLSKLKLYYFLEEIAKPTPKDVRDQILSSDMGILLTECMPEILKVQEIFRDLVRQEVLGKFLKRGTVMRILKYKASIEMY